jgi:thiamine-monophosphate kinase
MSHLDLGRGGEFDTIRQVVAALGDQADGIGGDCAFLPCGQGWMAVSTDTSVEGVHFKREWLSLTEIGWRAAAAALSDLAAVGAGEPRVLAAITSPERSEVVELMRGVGAAAEASGGVVVGGDLTRGRDLSLTLTVLGTTGRLVTRGGAQAGDEVWVTGHLGLARAAVRSWIEGREPSPAARTAFAHPESRLAAGHWLAGHGARAMIDLSDGLAGDAGHIAGASGCSVALELERLPIAPEVEAAAIRAGMPPAQFAALGGEDYELLVVVPPGFDPTGFGRETGVPLERIGRCVESPNSQPVAVMLLEGRPLVLSGFDHF